MRRWLALGLFALGALALWARLRPTRDGGLRAEAAPAEAAPTAAADGAPRQAVVHGEARPSHLPVSYSFGHPNPIIERVLVDKAEVCRGEEDFARVDVRTVDGTDSDVRITLAGAGLLGAGATGDHLPFRLVQQLDGDALPKIIVTGANGTHAEVAVPYVKVKDCDAGPFVDVVARRAPERGGDVFELEAVVHSDVALSSVTWRFGDGQTATTTEPRVSHDFGARSQGGQYSEFLIQATAAAADGRTLTGSRTLELVNPEYTRLHRRTI